MTARRVARSTAAGVLFINAVPHGIAAVQGRRFPSPFATPPGRGLSAPAVNAAWSTVNVVGALLALPGGRRSRADSIGLIAGAAAMGFFLATYFGGLTETSPEPERAPGS